MKISSWVDFHLSNTQAWLRNSTTPLNAILKMLFSILFYWLVSSDLFIIMPSNEWPYWWKSTMVQVMAWCRQATSHYLSQCWLSSLSPYGVARPQWVKSEVWCHMASLGQNELIYTVYGKHSSPAWEYLAVLRCVPMCWTAEVGYSWLLAAEWLNVRMTRRMYHSPTCCLVVRLDHQRSDSSPPNH